MVLCHETCPFGLVWTGSQEPRCAGCGAGAAGCRCQDEGMLRFSPPMLRNTRAELMGWEMVGARVVSTVQVPLQHGAPPQWFTRPGERVAA